MNEELLPDQLLKLGHNIRASRQARGLSQDYLAGACGLHRTYICDVERGARNVTLRSLIKLAFGLNMSVADLVQNIGNAVSVETPPAQILNQALTTPPRCGTMHV